MEKKEKINKYKELMKINYTYPDPTDPEFQYKIFKKREFYYNKIPYRSKLENYDEIKNYRDKICGGDFGLKEQQAFLTNFINPDTPYKGLLIFHGVGTGKTCAAITIAEKFKTRFACEVKNFNLDDFFDRKEARKIDRFSQLAIVSSDQAIKDANLHEDASLNKDRIGVIWASGIGGIGTFYEEMKGFFAGDGTPRFNPFFIPKR
jgi:hypothetical protein